VVARDLHHLAALTGRRHPEAVSLALHDERRDVDRVELGQPVDVVVNGNGEFTPAHVVGGTSVFIPTAFDITFTFTPAVGSPMSETDTASKAAPIENTTTCAIPLQTLFSGPEGSATIEGSVTGFFTPR